MACSDKPLVDPGDVPRIEFACSAGTTGKRLPAPDGVWLGVNLDWGRDTPSTYAARLGKAPAVVTQFAGIPSTGSEIANLDLAVEHLAEAGGMLLLTLEPRRGLAVVDNAAAEQVARQVAAYNARGVPVMLRFAHEMNGSWYEWSQQPAAYVAAFRRVAAAVHSLAPATAMLWAPNYGGGYPFSRGRFEARPGSTDARALDTNRDGRLDRSDDPYLPYYPGDDVVDWVGMSLYHWGNRYPWGANALPEPGKFEAMLTGNYAGSIGDEREVPDFYAHYGERRGKPVGIFETAALYAPGRGGAGETDVKTNWWRQVYAEDLPERFPRLGMINWFEWDKHETEVSGRVDWGVTRAPGLLSAYRAALPPWLRDARHVEFCEPVAGDAPVSGKNKAPLGRSGDAASE